MDGFEYNQIGM